MPTSRSGRRKGLRSPRSRGGRARRCRSGLAKTSSSTSPCATAIRASATHCENLIALGCERILVAPLYPQYCAATTATAMDAVYAALAKMRRQPALRSLPPYYDDELHIGALKASLERQLAALDFEPQRLLLSFHGMPQRTLELGDPYHCHCQKTARLLSRTARASRPTSRSSRASGARNGWNPRRTRSLRPIRSRASTRIAIAAPGFSADCVETVEELGIRGRETFIAERRRGFRAPRMPQRFIRRHDHAGGARTPRTCRLAATAISALSGERTGRDSWHALRS